MNTKSLKTSALLMAAALSGAALAGENVAQENIAAIYQPAVPVAVEGGQSAGGVSLLDGVVREWLDPSRGNAPVVEAGPDAAVADTSVSRSSNVAQDNIRGIYTAYSAN